ncbi:MAG: hypothetical protein JO061_11130 [Acidobacteriaceae bacterium]|nr:hypothetical protein [Acidobacteriaceae bacterium]
MRYLILVLFWASPVLLPRYAGADTISIWSGGGPPMSGWSNPANWSPQAVPNNSAGTAYDVVIPSGSFVTLDTSPNITRWQSARAPCTLSKERLHN